MGYFVRPAALGGRPSGWNLSPGVLDQLLSATAHGAFLRALLFAFVGLAAGLAAGWLIQRRTN